MPTAPLTFQVSLPNQKSLSVMLSRFASSIKDFRPFWNDYFGPLWYRHIDTVYTTQGGAVGQHWAELSTKYAEWKDAHWPGMPIGVLSGATRESLTSPDDQFAIWRASGTSLSVGTSVPHAIYQQMGTRRMPARPPLAVSRDFVLEIGRLLNEFSHAKQKEASA